MAAGMTSLVAVLFLTLTTVQTTTEARPNIVFILADDLLYLYLPTENTDGLYSAGWNDVSFHGSNQIPTPNIDSLAYSGIILNNYYVSPICTPTRSALMTGRHPIHTGLQHGVLVGAAPYGLPLSETIMPEYLKPLGYASHIVGKWHLGFYAKEVTPTYRGFDSHFGYWLGAEDYFDHVAQANLATSGLDFRRDMELVRNATNQYSTELFSSEAVKIIHQHNQSQPLFLYLPYQSVHSGNVYNRLQAPEKYVRRFPYIKNPARKIYAGMVSALDDGIGEVVKALKDTDMYKNSIIVFSTDNGGPANGFDGNAASNWPLRGMKNTLWEGGVRGTGFIHSSLLQKSAYLSEQMIHVCDWLPTLYRAAGGDPSILKNLDGFDLWDMLSSNGSSVRNELLHNIDPIGKFAAIRIGDYKLLQGKVSSRSDWYPPYQLQLDDDKTLHFESDANDQQKFSKRNAWSYSEKPVVVNCGRRPANASTNCNADNTPCLFHIPSDPCEYHNLASSRPDVLQDLLAWLEKYQATMVPPLNKPDDPAGNPKLHNGAWTPWINLKAAGL